MTKLVRSAAARRAAVRGMLLGLVCALGACSSSQPHKFGLMNVSKANEADLKLPVSQTTAGRPISAQRLRGRWVVLYFGYTHCPNVCPATLAKLNAALQSLKPKQAHKITVLFTSVDPKRDSRQVLTQYVHAFNPSFEALRPAAQALPRFTGRYHISYSYGKPNAKGYYTVNHSTQFMVFGSRGHMRLMGDYKDSVKAMAGDLRYLVKND